MNLYLPGRKTIAACLWALIALFCFRVGAQLLQLLYPVAFLPAFESWHSETMPYWILLNIQLMIIYCCVKSAYGIQRSSTNISPTLGKVLLVGGGIYLLTMTARLSLGLTLFSDHPWFSNHIPTFFHFVLAAFILLVSAYHLLPAKPD